MQGRVRKPARELLLIGPLPGPPQGRWARTCEGRRKVTLASGRLHSPWARQDEVLGSGLVLAERLGDIAGMGSPSHPRSLTQTHHHPRPNPHAGPSLSRLRVGCALHWQVELRDGVQHVPVDGLQLWQLVFPELLRSAATV
jgi:hypothetical protein